MTTTIDQLLFSIDQCGANLRQQLVNSTSGDKQQLIDDYILAVQTHLTAVRKAKGIESTTTATAAAQKNYDEATAKAIQLAAAAAATRKQKLPKLEQPKEQEEEEEESDMMQVCSCT